MLPNLMSFAFLNGVTVGQCISWYSFLPLAKPPSLSGY